MIDQALSLVGSMYAAVGPGLLLVASLPFLLVALFFVMRALREQLKS